MVQSAKAFRTCALRDHSSSSFDALDARDLLRRNPKAGQFLESLEPRTLMTALFVGGGAADATHFNTLQAALGAAGNGDSILLQNGFSAGASSLTVDKSITLTADPGLTLSFTLRVTASNVHLSHLTFNVSNGDVLTLDHANGAVIDLNTIHNSSPFSRGIVVHNSDDVVIRGNAITTTGMMGTGVYAYSDGMGSTSVDLNGNTVQTTDGTGIYLAKLNVTAAFEARVQGNILHNNMVALYVFGDGVTMGNVDAGGGTTRFGAGLGGNDFSDVTSADLNHFAIGLFATTAGATLHANGNTWGVANPLSVVADAAHIPFAFGSGIITTDAIVIPAPVEALSATGMNLSGMQTGTTTGVVALFSSNFAHVAGDFTATITWGDGTTSVGLVVARSAADGGGFAVMGSHVFNDAGSFALSVAISDAAASTTATSTATVAARALNATGVNFSVIKNAAFNSVVARFTDSLGGTSAGDYVAGIAWSDGVTTSGVISKNADGSFSIKTSRTFGTAGVMLASVSVSTMDGTFAATTNLTGTIEEKTNPQQNNCCRKYVCQDRDLRRLESMVKTWLETCRRNMMRASIGHTCVGHR